MDLFKQPCEFMWGSATADQLPPATLPEVAFAGRSNVGKSSLLNALTKRKSLARTSKTPGCTQQVNFFKLADSIILADIPGYGYARASKKDVANWHALIHDYLLGRPNLRRVFLLIDSRHGYKSNDREIMAELDEAAVSYQIVLTKIDKASDKERKKIIAQHSDLGIEHTALHPEILETSSKDHLGMQALRGVISAIANEG